MPHSSFMLLLVLAAVPQLSSALRSDSSHGDPVGNSDQLATPSDQLATPIVLPKPKARSFLTSPSLSPAQFLLISSPSKSRITWTTLQNLESAEQRTFPLVDGGLSSPKGLAFDHKNGFLYVADSGAEKIYRYSIIVNKPAGGKVALTTSHVRLTIVQNCGPVEWVTVDAAGNLFYAAPKTQNINKVPTEVMKLLATGEIKASQLTIVSEKTLEAQQKASNALLLMSDGDALPTDPPPPKPHILSIYEADLNPRVAAPAAITAEGPDLYWANQKDGTTAGTIVRGLVSPNVTKNADGTPAPFPATSLNNESDGAQSIAKTADTLFYTHKKGENYIVSAFRLEFPQVFDFVESLVKPRALVWDKDSTMFVADEAQNMVLSFPTSRLMSNVPTSKAIDMAGPYGLVILSSADPWFSQNAREHASQNAVVGSQGNQDAGEQETSSSGVVSWHLTSSSIAHEWSRFDSSGNKVWILVALATVFLLYISFQGVDPMKGVVEFSEAA